MRLSIDHIQSERLPHLSLRVNHLELPRLLFQGSSSKAPLERLQDSTPDNKQSREFKFQCSSSLLVNTIKIEICSNEICSKTIQKKSGECTSNECASVSVETVCGWRFEHSGHRGRVGRRISKTLEANGTRATSNWRAFGRCKVPLRVSHR